MPTTCCWTLVEYSLLWIHVQYFVILDVLLGYDVSSDIMNDIGEGEGTIGQAGATFYGALLDHLTAAPIWISIDGAFVTIVCPGKCYNCAWGKGGGDSVATRARKAQEAAERAAARRRVAGTFGLGPPS